MALNGKRGTQRQGNVALNGCLVISEEDSVVGLGDRLVFSEETSVVVFGGGLVISEGTSVVALCTRCQ